MHVVGKYYAVYLFCLKFVLRELQVYFRELSWDNSNKIMITSIIWERSGRGNANQQECIKTTEQKDTNREHFHALLFCPFTLSTETGLPTMVGSQGSRSGPFGSF